MIIRKGPACWAILFSLTLALSVYAQGRRNGQQQQPQQQQQVQPQPQQGVGPIPQSKDEAEAFNGLQTEQAPAKKVELAEAFVAKYPNSDFVQYAHALRVGAYSQLGKPKEAIASAEQAIDATVKFGEKLVEKADSDA